MKQKAVIFPFCAEILPAVKLFEKLQSEYSLQYLVSPKGFGYAGRDAAYACNHPPIGLNVLDEIPFEKDDWDILILFEPMTQKGYIPWKDIISHAMDNNKEIVFLDTKGRKVPEGIVLMEQGNIGKIMANSHIDLGMSGLTKKVHETELPVILVGGLLKEADCFEVFLKLLETLKKEGWNVAAFSNHPISILFECYSMEHIWRDSKYTEAEKITQMNIYINDITKCVGANIILLEAPDAFMKYNECVPNGYGIGTYMLTQAITPDYMVCCVPFELAESFFLEKIGENFWYRFGSNINAVHISNVLLDAAATLQSNQIEVLYVDMKFVHRKLRQVQKSDGTIGMFNVVEEGADSLYQLMINK